jgi:flagellar biosynthetic protein FliR
MSEVEARAIVAFLDWLAVVLPDLFWSGLLVFVRVGAVMALLPAFGEQTVPMRVRLVLALAFSAVVLPAVAGRATLPEGPLPVGPVLAEAMIGLALGAGFRLFVIALQTAGTIAANATSLSQILGGAGVDPQPAMAQILMVAGVALAVALGLHVRVAEVLILSYDLLPAGRLPSGSEMLAWGLPRVAESFALAFSLAAPFAIAAVLYNAALGVINRAMPQLMVAFVGAPAITAGGLALLALTAPAALAIWTGAFERQLLDPFGARP